MTAVCKTLAACAYQWLTREAHAAQSCQQQQSRLVRARGFIRRLRQPPVDVSATNKVQHHCGDYTIRLSVEQQAASVGTLRAAVKDYEATRAAEEAASKEQAAKNKVAKKAAKQAGEEHMAAKGKKAKKAKTE